MHTPRTARTHATLAAGIAIAALTPALALGSGRAFDATRAARVLYSFNGTSAGGAPASALIPGSSGSLYGTTALGGAYVSGTVFKLAFSAGKWREAVLHSFGKGRDGCLPQTDLVTGGDGSIYGTTSAGGISANCMGAGSVFELVRVRQGWREVVLHDFTGGADGGAPAAGLVIDGHGNVYGTTSLGGHIDPALCPNGCGTVFELTRAKSGWRYTALYDFRNALDANDPEAPLLLGKNGNLYGTTEGGGNTSCIQDGGCGTVFELARAAHGWKETVLHRFRGVNGDGARPGGGLVWGQNGSLVGTTSYGGGPSNSGTVFELFPGSKGWTEKIIYRFRGGSDGYFPVGTLASGQNGNLYGVTNTGGNSGCQGLGCGTVFKLHKSGPHWVKSGLYDFPGGYRGWSPTKGLTLVGGNLFGTTENGGTFKYYGLVFEISTPRR